MDKSILIVKAPDEQEGGAYALVLSRGMPFGGSGGSNVFYVDTLEMVNDSSGRAVMFEAKKADGTLVANFPVGSAYLMTLRSQTKTVTRLETLLEEKAEDEEIEAAMTKKDDKPAEKQPGGGQYL